ncbi:MAG: glycosyltransferase, partial [Krumholzibacteria bacterium]|nr:glycosyltransferase [Candidatus Krumholzibacteria bacterium]
MIQLAPRHPELSVVVPVRNEAAHIRGLLAQLCDQSLAPDSYEILVIDGYSDDETRDLVRAAALAHPHLHLLYNPGITSGSGRNLGARHACGAYLLFVDGHCRVESRTMLESALAAFRRGERCLSRPQPLLAEGVTLFQRAVALARGSALGHHTGSKIYDGGSGHCNPLSAGCGYTRGLYADLGGVDEAFDAGEDLEFNLRVHRQGVEAYHDPDLTVSYYPRAGWRALFRQLYRYGHGRALMARRYPGSVSPPATLLAGFVLWLVALPVAGAFWAPAWQAWAAVAGAYTAAVAVYAGHVARWRPGRLWAAVASCFAAVHLGAGLGYLVGLAGGPG